jgi:hypothetical protein
VPIRGGPHAVLALRFADAWPIATTPRWRRPAPGPPGSPDRIRGQSEKALAHFIRQHADGQGRAGGSRGGERPQRHPARGRERRRVVMGASAGPTPRRRDVPVRGAAGGGRHRSRRRSSSSRRASDRQGHVRAARDAAPKRWPRPSARPTNRAPSRCESSAGSASPTSTTANSATWTAWSTSRSKQGLTVSLVLPTLNERRRSASSSSGPGAI